MELFRNFTRIPFDYVLILWVTNYAYMRSWAHRENFAPPQTLPWQFSNYKLWQFSNFPGRLQINAEISRQNQEVVCHQ